MKASIVTAVFSVLAIASPIQEEKRYVVTDVVLQTVTVTVTAPKHWGPWKSHPTSSNTVSIVSSSQPSPAQGPQPSDAGGSVSSYAEPIIQQHNLHRRNHSVVDLAWDDHLAQIAAQIAQSCQYAHNTKAGGGGYGQNIGAGAPPGQIDAMITNEMYNNEMALYPAYGSEPDMSNFEKWGHFSQIVWKDTTRVGCYTQHCTNGLGGVASNVAPYFTVCNYQPTGMCKSVGRLWRVLIDHRQCWRRVWR